MQFVDLHRQYERIEGSLQKRLAEVFKEKKFINGDEIAELEDELKCYTGAKYVLACASGTDALVIPMKAIGLKENDAVFVPSFTFFASAESVNLAGGTPVFVDVDKDTFCIGKESLVQKIEEVKAKGELNPRGVIAVDLFGYPSITQDIECVAKDNGLFLLEDGAQGFGGSLNGAMNCSRGLVAGTSFFPAKPLGCYGDGGAIFTNDAMLHSEMKCLHIHGQHEGDNVAIGLNSRLDTIQAVVLLEKLKLLDEELEMRQDVADRYSSMLEGIAKTPELEDGVKSAWAQYTMVFDTEAKRDSVANSMREHGIPFAIYYKKPIHKTAIYEGDYDLPNTEWLSKRVLSLPMHPYLTEIEQEAICNAVKEGAR